MTLIDVVITALVALRSNFLRTLLTMLGIIIGIAAVITLTAAGAGAQQGVAARIKGLGSNLHVRQPVLADSSGRHCRGARRPGASLYYEDEQAIRDANIPGIDETAAQSTTGGAGSFIQVQAIYGGVNASTLLVGAEPSYQYVRDFYVANGRFISQDDLDKKALVVVLGAQVADEFFGNTRSRRQHHSHLRRRQPPVRRHVQLHRRRRDGAQGRHAHRQSGRSDLRPAALVPGPRPARSATRAASRTSRRSASS